jgi:hypothetical protein
MAVQISENTFNLRNGLSFDSVYIRIIATINENGDKINIRTNSYLSKDKYNNGNRISLPINFTRNIEYNREQDGADILQIAHNTIKQDLIDNSIPEEKIEIVDITL